MGEHYGVEGMDAVRADQLGAHWVALGRWGVQVGRDSSEMQVVGPACFLLTNSEQDLSSSGHVCGDVASYLC